DVRESGTAETGQRHIAAVTGAEEMRALALLAALGVLAQSPAAKDLVGTWTLSAVEKTGADGKWNTQIFPRGLLIFDRAGHAFEQAETGRSMLYATNPPKRAEAEI